MTMRGPGARPVKGPNLITRAAISGFIGLMIGIVVSLIVNCTLLEISLNSFFATYFGLLFVGVGLMIIWRVRNANNQQSEERENDNSNMASQVSVILQGNSQQSEEREDTDTGY
jgi:high-affinity Fe2+/Pb2+ permease